MHPYGPELALEEFYIRRGRKNKNRIGTECKACIKAKNKTYRDKRKDYHIEYRKNNQEYFLEYGKRYREDNKERFKKYYDERNPDDSAEYYIRNKHKILEYGKQYRQNNKGKVNALTRKYQAAKLNAIPLWAEIDKIKEVYLDCEEINIAARLAGCMEKFVVDHIIPLQGEFISVLHIEYNLQIITLKENARKGNKYV